MSGPSFPAVGIPTRGIALVVAYDRAISSAIGGWLEDVGFRVELCPGPLQPDYRCIGSVEGECPLARIADLVILDAWLQSDADDRGSAALDLVGYYRTLGKPLLILDHASPTSSFFVGERVAILSWPPNRREVERWTVALARNPVALNPAVSERFFGMARPARGQSRTHEPSDTTIEANDASVIDPHPSPAKTLCGNGRAVERWSSPGRTVGYSGANAWKNVGNVPMTPRMISTIAMPRARRLSNRVRRMLE
jgi:hypothetical protein